VGGSTFSKRVSIGIVGGLVCPQVVKESHLTLCAWEIFGSLRLVRQWRLEK